MFSDFKKAVTRQFDAMKRHELFRVDVEIVGAKMKTEESTNQLSGLGFSSTQRNYVLCRVKGSFSRTIKITF